MFVTDCLLYYVKIGVYWVNKSLLLGQWRYTKGGELMSKITTNTTLIISLFLAVVMSSVTYAKADKKDLPKETKDGLVLKEDAEVDIAYIRPNVDWNKFKTVYFRTLIVSDEAKDATPDKPGSRRGH